MKTFYGKDFFNAVFEDVYAASKFQTRDQYEAAKKLFSEGYAIARISGRPAGRLIAGMYAIKGKKYHEILPSGGILWSFA